MLLLLKYGFFHDSLRVIHPMLRLRFCEHGEDDSGALQQCSGDHWRLVGCRREWAVERVPKVMNQKI